QGGLGTAIREPSAQPVADRERAQDDPDEVGPDDGRRSEVRSEKARRGDLRREGPDPGPEHERAEREAARPLSGGRRWRHEPRSTIQSPNTRSISPSVRAASTAATTTTRTSTSQKRTPAQRFSRWRRAFA